MNYIYYNKNLTKKAKENRANPTVAEKIMWKILRDKQFENYKFIRQKPIENFIVDFYCSELLLAIEIDGDSHAFQESYDSLRTEKLNALGVKVIRYANSEIISSIEGVYEDLKNKIIKIAGNHSEKTTSPTLPKRLTPPTLPLSGEELRSPPDKGD